MSSPVELVGIGLASPASEVRQHEARDFARALFASQDPRFERMLALFENTGIDSRQLARAPTWYSEQHSFADKNEVWRDEAIELSVRAGAEALRESGISESELGALCIVSSTGIAAPTLDSWVIPRLKLPDQIMRVPLWGLGCAGGAAGLSRGAALCRGLDAPVLVICVELCSTTFIAGDRSKSNFVATALFGDGAAAVVLRPGRAGEERSGGLARLGKGHSQVFEDSLDVMGWELEEAGLRVRFAKQIPRIVHDQVPAFVSAAASREGVDRFDDFVLHPGGAKVIDAYEEVLPQLAKGEVLGTGLAREVLARHGNMSGPTVLFALRHWLDGARPGQSALTLGLGPGFAAEGIALWKS